MLELNIGSSHTYLPGFVNVDIDPRADVVLDLGVDKLPYDDDSVDLVFSHHTLEHIPDYLHAMREIHRVLKHDGLLLVGLPYVSLTEYHLVNPYHLHNFNEHSFAFFDPARLRGSAAEGDAPVFAELWCRLNYVGRYGRLPARLRRWCRAHLLNIVRTVDFAVVAVKEPDLPVDLSDERRRRAVARYDELVAGRLPRTG